MNRNTVDSQTRQWVCQAKRGDQDSLGLLAKKVETRLMSYLYRLTLDHDVAQELCQQTIVKMVDSAVRIPLTPANPEIGQRLSQALEEARFGVKTPEEALNWAAEESQALLDEYWSSM